MSDYAWFINKDHVVGDDDPKLSKWEDIAVMGPEDATDEQIKRLLAGEGHAFRMYDDDGFINLSGRFLGDQESEDGFGPLNDYGSISYGCTYIQYMYKGKWETL